MKRIVLFVLMISIFALHSIASYSFTYDGLHYSNVDKISKTCSVSKGEEVIQGSVTIPSVAYDGTDNYTVIEISSYGFYGCENLTSVKIPNTVIGIGDDAFMYCTGLTKVVFPDSVSLGKRVFYGCDSLASLEMPKKMEILPPETFSSCGSLISIVIPDDVFDIGYSAFSGCWNLTSVDMPDCVSKIGGEAFMGCHNLSSVVIPDPVTVIEARTFEECDNLSSVKLPASLTTIGWNAFSGCSSLTSIEIPNKVEVIGFGAFSGCNLKSIKIPEGVTVIQTESFSCEDLSYIEIPSTVTLIENMAFGGGSALKEIHCHAVTPPNVDDYNFVGTETFSCTLYVPEKAIEAYRKHEVWQNFFNIKSEGIAGIDNVKDNIIDTKMSVEVYSIGGVKVGNDIKGLAPGIYILRQGRETRKLIIR